MKQSTCGEIRALRIGIRMRVGAGALLAAPSCYYAMNVAWDVGITLFDTARSYGYGDAEAVLGEFLRGKRDQAVVATKYGIAPQAPGATAKRMAIPVVRAALHVPGVRGWLLRLEGKHSEVISGQFTVAGLRASIEASLSTNCGLIASTCFSCMRPWRCRASATGSDGRTRRTH